MFLRCLESCSAHSVVSISVKCDLTVEPFFVVFNLTVSLIVPQC